MVLPAATTRVPPQARTCGLEAGKSTWSFIRFAVSRAIVARRDADGDAQRSGLLHGGVVGLQRLWRPRAFRSAPADRHHGWTIPGVMDRAGNGVEKAGVGVRRKVDDDVRFRG